MALVLRHNRNFRKSPSPLHFPKRPFIRSLCGRSLPSLTTQQHPPCALNTGTNPPCRVLKQSSKHTCENVDRRLWVESPDIYLVKELEWRYRPYLEQRCNSELGEVEEGLLTNSAINEKLRKYEKTNLTQISKMPRFDTNQLPSNSPIEDYHTELSNDTNDAWYFGVFDGHAGKHCSQKLASKLVQQVRHNIEELRKSSDQNATDLISQSMIRTFESLDREIVWGSLGEIIINTEKAIHASLPAAVAGSCAVVGYIDIKSMEVYVANTGDSRAVIGSLDGSNTWSSLGMSNDQNTANKEERRRLHAEHPGEEATIISKERVLGALAPTRAFGDSRYKWSARTQLAVKENFFPRIRAPPAHYHTPPYVTATPEVMHHQLRPQDKFMVIASDGLFDLLSNDEIVFLVGTYLEGKSDSSPRSLPQRSGTGEWAYVDDNVATHLIRNALGGASKERLSRMLSAEAPHSRNLRDDITVTVIFFEAP